MTHEQLNEIYTKEQLASAQRFNQIAIEGMQQFKYFAHVVVAAADEMEKGNLWGALGCASFEAWVSENLGISAKTVRGYIQIRRKLLNDGVAEKEMEDVSFEKLAIIKDIPKKDKWIVYARSNSMADLITEVRHKIHGITPEEQEKLRNIKKHEKNESTICLLYDPKKCKCAAGVDIKKELKEREEAAEYVKGKKKKSDDLI